MVLTRLDILYAMSVVSIFMACPGRERCKGVTYLMRYLRGTLSFGLLYERKNVDCTCLGGFVDSDYTRIWIERGHLQATCFSKWLLS